MNPRTLACGFAAAFAAALACGEPVDDLKAALGKLAEAPNFTWTSTTQNADGGGGGQFGGGPTVAVTEKDGYTVVTRETRNGAFRTVAKSDKRAIETPNGWVTPEELRAQFQQRQGGGGGQGGGAFRGLGGVIDGPADIIALVLSEASDFKEVDGAIVGELSLAAAGRMLRPGARAGQGSPPADAKGTVSVWLKDGIIAKISVHLTGTLQGRDGAERKVDRTTVTEIKDVGTTKVEVPAEALAKLGA